MDWKTIDSAPKDKRFLAYWPDGVIDFCRWQDFGNDAPVGWRDNFIHVYAEGDPSGPTHWVLVTPPIDA